MPISLALIADLFPMEERQTAIGTFMGVSFLGQGLSMAIGGTIAYLVSWRGVFASYAGLSVIATALLLGIGESHTLPAQSPEQDDRAVHWPADAPGKRGDLSVVLFEGILIVGSFSYLGAYIARTYRFDNLVIGLIMTAFGVMAVLAGRISGSSCRPVRKTVRPGGRPDLGSALRMRSCSGPGACFLRWLSASDCWGWDSCLRIRPC